jgi:hypothetical protein
MTLWIAVYRLPFGDASRRRRVALWLADRTRLAPDPAFAVFATVLYVGLGLVVTTVLFPMTGLSVSDLVGAASLGSVAALLLAVLGTSSLNSLCISVLYRAVPDVDVPGEIARIQWVSSILTLPRRARWIIPAVAAAVEELVFRGVVFGGLVSAGAALWFASAVSTLLFALGQVVLVSTRIQAVVMGTSSIILGTVGTLLVAGTGSLIPALILHMSFAGFYTNLSASGRGRAATRKVLP